ncbi:pirin [Jeotgalibacillus malaysiensis]|uniref:Pirin n=1 Tax=Jeotgalibacillus malaysiensis TaxID=1508404 RepID=A0A0B5AW77_9BACL|nr:pirin-like C-terminal cupin domain-containing protein [Jeotgalibacillus malaysiensis]AJD92818.1 pirin [Jeotgalibacillus malaysiensis]
MTEENRFKRDVKDHWRVSYNQNGYPHVQQGWILPPERMKEFDPFILMADDWFKRGTFSDHPHRGFQTITYVVDGRLEHIDNHGGHSILDAGDVQYMNAGWAARHGEEAVDDDLIHTFQLWLNLPHELRTTTTSYQNVYLEDAPVAEVEGGSVRVYSGEIAGVKGPMESLVPITMTEIRLKEGAEYKHVIPENHNGFFYVTAGEIEAGESSVPLAKTDVGILTYKEDGSDAESEFTIRAKTRARLLLYSGVPLKEDYVAHGPFVMSNMDEIRDAMRDFQAGKFGKPAVK